MTVAEPSPFAVESGLPEGWAFAPLMSLCVLVRGVSYAKGEETSGPRSGYIPLLRANNISGTINFDDIRFVPPTRVSQEQRLRKGDVVIAMSSGSKSVVGKAATLSKEWKGTFGAFCGTLRPAAFLDWRYFGLFFQTRGYRESISEMSAGVNINNLKREYFEGMQFPVAPLAEQWRIADKIEQLLTSLNAAREHLANVPDILKRFRLAVLAAACSGNLTADWRELRGVVGTTIEFVQIDRGQIPFEIPTCWRWVRLDQCATIERGRFSVRPRNDPRYYGGHVPFVQIGDLPPDGGDIKAFTQTLNEKGLSVSKLFPKGTVLIAIVGATIGNTGVLTFDSCCPDSLVAIRGKSESHSKLIEYYLRLTKMNVRAESYASGGQPNINLQTLRPMLIPYCSPEEMDEIVRRVDGLLTLADTIERRVAMATARAEKLTQAILAKAFRGELVPTEAELARREGRSYEPASALLARIRSERSATIS